MWKGTQYELQPIFSNDVIKHIKFYFCIPLYLCYLILLNGFNVVLGNDYLTCKRRGLCNFLFLICDWKRWILFIFPIGCNGVGPIVLRFNSPKAQYSEGSIERRSDCPKPEELQFNLFRMILNLPAFLQLKVTQVNMTPIGVF